LYCDVTVQEYPARHPCYQQRAKANTFCHGL
jgi:hypothetical protein